jgi:hypothetical protein
LENAKLIKAPPKPRTRAQTNELRSTDPCRSIPNMGRTTLISNGTVSESVTMIRMLAANSRNMPFIHFIEILLQDHVLAPSLGESSVRMIILTDSLKCISSEIARRWEER